MALLTANANQVSLASSKIQNSSQIFYPYVLQAIGLQSILGQPKHQWGTKRTNESETSGEKYESV